jgi:hypothetical protein
MTTTKSNLIPLAILPGVQPSTDKTAFSTPHYTAADKIRFRFGFPQKIGGWYAILFNLGATISGKIRTIFSAVLSTSINTVIGTNSNFYSLSGSSLTNITPLVATPVALSTDPLTSIYIPLANNAITTVNGSTVITVSMTVNVYQVGDILTFSGLTAFNGLSLGNLNAAHPIHTIIDSTHLTVITAGTANASGAGGGNSAHVASGFINVAGTTGLTNGQRVKIAGATDTGGITAAQINQEFIVRVTATNAFNILTSGTSTSLATGGGAGVTYQKQIADGNADQSIGQGYGMGKYGVGLYGTALMSASALSYPRIWFIDRFGANLIMSAGNQTGVYTWSGDNSVAPVLLTNAPTAVNYVFVSNNIVVTLGAGGTINRIFTSDQTNSTNWTTSSTNQVFDYTVTGAGQFRSHVPVNGVNLLFTDHQTYYFAYQGFNAGAANAIWDVQLLDNNIGIIAPMARVTVGGNAYWMDVNNFYVWKGGNISIVGANSQENSTILNYVFKNINLGQSSKCFAFYNEQYDEIWWHYPSAGSNECDRVARFNVSDQTWVPDTFDRTAAEYPNLTLGYPRLASSTGVLYAHEQGNNADGAAMLWSLTSNLRGGDFTRNAAGGATNKTYLTTAIVPDSIQTGNITCEITGKQYPQSALLLMDNTFTVTPTSDVIPLLGGARLWQYTLSGNTLNQQWVAGQWQQFVQEASGQ